MLIQTAYVSEVDEFVLSKTKRYPVWVKFGPLPEKVFGSYAEWASYLVEQDLQNVSMFIAGACNDETADSSARD